VLRLEQVKQMSLGRQNDSVARTHGSTDVFGLAGFLRDDDLIGHSGSFGKMIRLEHTVNMMGSQVIF